MEEIILLFQSQIIEEPLPFCPMLLAESISLTLVVNWRVLISCVKAAISYMLFGAGGRPSLG
jgi:hypothetical protein